jgi:alcohol dehydrogenase, propanol-preferring
LTCAGVTTCKAVKVGNVRPGNLVAISGIGGLGHMAVQYARIFGGTVAAVDITDEKLQLAKDLGADIVIDAPGSATRPGRWPTSTRQSRTSTAGNAAL